MFEFNCFAMPGLRLAFIVAAAATFAHEPAHAQSDYPNRHVQIVVPYGPGGVADVGHRIVADKLSARLKQQFVVDNRPGAGGIVAAKAVAAASADGYTLLMTGNQNAIGASLFKSLPYNILSDFVSVSTTSFFDLLIVTRSGSPSNSVDDVIRAARANPGKLNIATINPGSTQNLAAELFKSVAGIDATVVPFRTSSDMATAILRGDVDIAFEIYAGIYGLIDDKKLRVLASTGPTRSTYLPSVPTVQESGLSYEVVSWNGISAPAGTPPSVIAVLGRALNEVLQAPDVQARARTLGLEMRGSTPEEMTARMRADIAKWARVIEQAGIPKRD